MSESLKTYKDRFYYAIKVGSVALLASSVVSGASSCNNENLQEIEAANDKRIYESIENIIEAEKQAKLNREELARAEARRSAGAVKGNAPRIATFNGLGGSHDNEPQHRDKPNWRIRTLGMIALFERHGIDIVGVQEFQKAQWQYFKENAGDQWAIYPAVADFPFPSVNSFIYNKDTVNIIEGKSGVRGGYKYFSGKPNMSVPYVTAEFDGVNEEYMLIVNHYPAFTGNAKSRAFDADRDRDWAEARFNEGERVLVLGDHNAHGSIRKPGDNGVTRNELPYCIITVNGIMRHTVDAKRNNNDPDADYNCKDRGQRRIDHIYASKNIEVVRTGDVSSGNISDHPLIYADVRYSNTPAEDSMSLNLPEDITFDEIEFALAEDVYARSNDGYTDLGRQSQYDTAA